MKHVTAWHYQVVHVAETIRGGIATYLREILPLQVLRYGQGQVVLIAPQSQLVDIGEIEGVELIGFDTARSRIGSAWNARLCLNGLLESFSSRVVHVHSTFAGITCRLLTRWQKRRYGSLIYCPHGWSFIRESRGATMARVIERLLSFNCAAIVCVSDFERRAALSAGLPSRKLFVASNGLPDRTKSEILITPTWPDDVLKLIFIGRFDRAKGFDVLLNALGRVKRRIHVHVFGESVLHDELLPSVPGCVELHGWTAFTTIEPYLLTCDAIVMPSRWEAIGLAGLEAMRASKAVLASRVGGLPEIVNNGVTGYLFEPNDAGALSAVLDHVDPATLKDMGIRGRSLFLDRFLIDTCEGALASLYARQEA